MVDTDRLLARAAIRADIVKRLFAVAISVGFAARLAQMDWVKNGTFPNFGEWQQNLELFTALVATLLSWDSYLLSIKEKKLTAFDRFAIDVLLIFIYMFLLITSKYVPILICTVATIFLLYVLWDALSIRDYPDRYSSAFATPARASVAQIGSVYVGGFRGRVGVSRNPAITFSWAVYFCFLAGIRTQSTPNSSVRDLRVRSNWSCRLSSRQTP